MTDDDFNSWYNNPETKSLLHKLFISYMKTKTVESTKTQDYQIINLAQKVIVSFHKPVWFKLNKKDETQIEVDSWQHLFLSFLNAIIYQSNGDSWIRIYSNPLLHQRLFEHKHSNLRRPKKLDNGVNVETNFGADDLLKIMRQIGDILGITGNIIIAIKPVDKKKENK